MGSVTRLGVVLLAMLLLQGCTDEARVTRVGRAFIQAYLSRDWDGMAALSGPGTIPMIRMLEDRYRALPGGPVTDRPNPPRAWKLGAVVAHDETYEVEVIVEGLPPITLSMVRYPEGWKVELVAGSGAPAPTGSGSETGDGTEEEAVD